VIKNGGISNIVQCLPGQNAVFNFQIFRKKDDTEVFGANVYRGGFNLLETGYQPWLIGYHGQSAGGPAHSKTLARWSCNWIDWTCVGMRKAQ
jgi:hypothetical protein